MVKMEINKCIANMMILDVTYIIIVMEQLFVVVLRNNNDYGEESQVFRSMLVL